MKTTQQLNAEAEAVRYARVDLGHPLAEVVGCVFRDRPPVYPATAEALVLISVPTFHKMPSGRPKVPASPLRFSLLVQQRRGAGGRPRPFEVVDETNAADFYRNGGHDAAKEA